MSKLDEQYIAKLVQRTQAGNMNAFAELYTATYQERFSYSYRYLQDEELAKKAMRDTYMQALQSINTINNMDLFAMWLLQINFEVCYNLNEENESGFMRVSGKQYRVKQLLKTLPITEAMALVMKYYQHETIHKIAKELDLTRAETKRCIKTGKKHIEALLQG